MNELSAVILDPQPLWLEAVQQVLDRMGIEVVGKTTSTDVARKIVQESCPDVVVTELLAQHGEGLSWLDDARQKDPELRVIVLSMHDEEEDIDAALNAGAVAYVLKTAHPDDLAAAIRHGFAQSVYLAGPRAPAQPRKSNGNGAAPDASSLTARQLEILRLVSEGHSNAELARRLWVTEQTVKFHLSNIYRKLEVANRTEASRWARVRGLLDHEPA